MVLIFLLVDLQVDVSIRKSDLLITGIRSKNNMKKLSIKSHVLSTRSRLLFPYFMEVGSVTLPR